MTIEDVLKMLDSGFTADEIRALTAEPVAPPTEPVSPPAEPVTPSTEPVTPPAEPATQSTELTNLDDIRAELAELKKLVQGKNIQRMEMPTPDPAKNPLDFLSEMNGYIKKERKN